MEYYKNKKILIAGGSGLVGTNLLIYLSKINKNVVASFYSKIQNRHYKRYYKKYDFRKLKDCLKATKNKDIVFITAVKGSGILDMKENFKNSVADNFLIRSNLLQSCVHNKVKKVLWVSSSTVYQPDKKPIREKDLNLNKNPYDIYMGTGWLYRYLEKLCEFYRKEKKLDVKIIRTTSIYGPYDNFDEKKSHVIPALIKKACLKGKLLEVWGDPKVVRDFVYVGDLVKAMLIYLPKKKSFIINFSSGKGTSIESLALKILNLVGANKKITFQYINRSSAIFRVLNNNRYDHSVKKFTRTSLTNGLSKTYKWYKNR